MNFRRFFTLLLLSMLVFCQSAAVSAEGGKEAPISVKADLGLDYAKVINVDMIQSKDGSWCIYTTVRHNDEGWDHYANAWQVLDMEGNEIAWRMLAHPHDDEQPFERDQCAVSIPPEVSKLIVQAKCNVHGFGGQTVIVDMSVPKGENFTVVRAKQ